VEPEKAIEEERGEAGDLVKTGIAPDGWRIGVGLAILLSHEILPGLTGMLWRPSQEDMG
jgi:hypothetical protein